MGKQYRFIGPLRGEDEQQASQDVYYIRAAAEGSLSHVDGLCAMQVAAKLLRDEAKALARGGIKQDAAGRWFARFQYVDCGITNKEIGGPPRQSQRRAENDLATLREAARAQSPARRRRLKPPAALLSGGISHMQAASHRSGELATGSFIGISTGRIEAQRGRCPLIRPCMRCGHTRPSRFAFILRGLLAPASRQALERLAPELLQILLHADPPALLSY